MRIVSRLLWLTGLIWCLSASAGEMDPGSEAERIRAIEALFARPIAEYAAYGVHWSKPVDERVKNPFEFSKPTEQRFTGPAVVAVTLEYMGVHDRSGELVKATPIYTELWYEFPEFKAKTVGTRRVTSGVWLTKREKVPTYTYWRILTPLPDLLVLTVTIKASAVDAWLRANPKELRGRRP